MGYEVELKAWVEDWDVIETRLRGTSEFIREFRKSDRYFQSRLRTERESSFRLREDGESVVIAFKKKRPRGGVEFNLEREFSVDNGSAFLDLVKRINFVEYASKIKTGLEFRSERMTIELLRVEGLGSFLELEIIEPEADSASDDRAAALLLAFLGSTGINRGRIEEQSYIELLRRKEVGENRTSAG